jgi:arsenite-transporting ATPase
LRSDSLKNLYIFTGKGGVGKTTLALCFARYLQLKNKPVTYISLSQQKLSDEKKDDQAKLKIWPELDQKHLELEECAEGYIQKKLNSQMIAKWVVKSAYFRALVNMLPGFGYLISLGKLLEMIHESSDERILVLDAPASGHALTMLEATQNFKEIFQSGLVFEDTNKMLAKLYDPNHTAIRIISLATSLAMQEAVELKESIKKLSKLEPSIYLNQSIIPWREHLTDAPAALMEKLNLEVSVMDEYTNIVQDTFGLSAKMTLEEQYEDLKIKLGSFE